MDIDMGTPLWKILIYSEIYFPPSILISDGLHNSINMKYIENRLHKTHNWLKKKAYVCQLYRIIIWQWTHMTHLVMTLAHIRERLKQYSLIQTLLTTFDTLSTIIIKKILRRLAAIFIYHQSLFLQSHFQHTIFHLVIHFTSLPHHMSLLDSRL